MKNWMLVILTIMTGCSPLYVPNSRNSPMFRKAGEFQGSISFGNGLDVQGAVAVSNHIGIMANYSYADYYSSNYTTNSMEDEFHYHNFLEGGVGYFENQGSWCYEIFAGYGKGEGSNYDSYVWWNNQNVRATGKYDRIFIQPAFGMNKKIFHMSIVPRISIVDFKEFSSDVSSFTIDESARFFFEPAFLGRVNLMNNHLFLAFQAGFSVPVASNVFYDYRPFQFSTGIGFRFGGLHGSKDE